MLYTKACPRCSGDIKLDRDNYGVYAKCLQCGFNRDFLTRRDAPMIGTGSLFGAEPVPAEGFEEAMPLEIPYEDQRDVA